MPYNIYLKKDSQCGT